MEILVRTQEDVDKLPTIPEEGREVVNIFADKRIVIVIKKDSKYLFKCFEESKVMAYHNSQVKAFDSSQVEAYNSSQVTAYDSSRVEAYNSSRVEAYNSSQVMAYHNSQVKAFDSSQVTAYDSSQVRVWGSSQVEAYNSSQVTAYDSSQVRVWGSSQVTAYDSSRVEAYNSSQVTASDSSQVTAYDSSQVRVWGSSQVEACMLSTIAIFSLRCKLTKLLDNAHLVCHINYMPSISELAHTAKITKYSDIVVPSFEDWLDRGVVLADGIFRKYLSHKKVGGCVVYTTDKGYVARKGDKFAHGVTIKKACQDLRYKISTRDSSKFLSWSKSDKKSLEDMIEAYRVITGACEIGTRNFVESSCKKKEYTVEEVLHITLGHYGNEKFTNFNWRN